MKKNIFKLLTCFFAVYALTACLGKDKEIEFPDNPDFVSLEFKKNDSIPNLETAVFSVAFDVDLNDSIIVNLDSLPYQTRIDSVFPTFAFRSSSYAYLVVLDSLETGYDTLMVTGKDTVNFEKVISITNFAANREASRSYPIKVNVHQVEPELYVWQKITDEIYSHSSNIQQALYFENRFLLYVSDGVANYLYASENAKDWGHIALTGLPITNQFRSIRAFDDELYLLHEDGKIYQSADGEHWAGLDPAVTDHTCSTLLFSMEDKLWALFRQTSDEQYYFSYTEDGANWIITDAAPTNFPVIDYAYLSFASRNHKPKALVLGGYAADGALLGKIWSVEKNIYGDFKWVDFTADKADPFAFAGASVIPYDNKLLMFGGIVEHDTIPAGGYHQSVDEGLTWQKTDSLYNSIFDTVREIPYEARSYQSVIVDGENHYIYLIGGKNEEESETQIYTDVWVGKLNRMSFLRK